jgi:CDP-diacylglycerol--serine O-phosphatidyltransferase
MDVTYGALVLTLAAGLLMVSRFSYYSFKDLNLREKVPFVTLLAAILAFVFLSLRPATVLFTFFFLYMLSGPVTSLFRWNRKRMRLAESAGGPKADS